MGLRGRRRRPPAASSPGPRPGQRQTLAHPAPHGPGREGAPPILRIPPPFGRASAARARERRPPTAVPTVPAPRANWLLPPAVRDMRPVLLTLGVFDTRPAPPDRARPLAHGLPG